MEETEAEEKKNEAFEVKGLKDLSIKEFDKIWDDRIWSTLWVPLLYFGDKDAQARVLLGDLAGFKIHFPKAYRIFQRRLMVTPWINEGFFKCLLLYSLFSVWSCESVLTGNPLVLIMSYCLWAWKNTMLDLATLHAFFHQHKEGAEGGKYDQMTKTGYHSFWAYGFIEVGIELEKANFEPIPLF